MLKRIILFTSIILLGFKTDTDTIQIDLKNPLKPVISVSLSNASKLNGAIPVEQGRKTLSVFMLVDSKVSTIPLIGNYTIQQNTLQFTPQNELGRGLEFEVQYYKAVGDTIKKRFLVPPASESKIIPSEVKQVFPRTNQIPDNILIFHIEFNNPMAKDIAAYQQVKIIDNSTGKEKEMVWRNKSYWINDRIFVMMIHPARVKRGIKDFAELGDLFTEGKEYTMVIGTEIKDREQRSLVKEYRKTFTIVNSDREMPIINYNAFILPAKNTKDPFRIVFSEGMDCVSILTGVKFYNASTNTAIEGEILYTENDSCWNFIPKNNWENIEYEIRFDKVIADFASNHIHRPFEITDINKLNEESMPRKWKFFPK